MEYAGKHLDEDSDSRFLKRRKFIRSRLRQLGKVTESEMREWLSSEGQTWSLKAMRKDIDFIERYEDKRIFESLSRDNGQTEWIDNSRKLGSTRSDRLAHNNEGKRAIAEILAALILGFRRARLQRSSTEKFTLSCLDDVMFSLGQFASTKDVYQQSIVKKLRSYWKEGERRLFLDAGTTTQLFSEEFIQCIHLPMYGLETETVDSKVSREQCINRLEVVTNDRHIYYRLGDANVHTRAIVIGGHQQYRSGALSGAMAEAFMDATKITAHVAIVGTTSVCLHDDDANDAFIGAENEHVANIKLRFLNRSDIRIVVADHSKFYRTGGHTDFRICPLSPRYVDLVITDSVDPEIKPFIDSLPVPVLVAKRL